MRSQGEEGARFGNLRKASLLFADDVALLASLYCDLQHAVEWFVKVLGVYTSKGQHFQV